MIFTMAYDRGAHRKTKKTRYLGSKINVDRFNRLFNSI